MSHMLNHESQVQRDQRDRGYLTKKHPIRQPLLYCKLYLLHRGQSILLNSASIKKIIFRTTLPDLPIDLKSCTVCDNSIYLRHLWEESLKNHSVVVCFLCDWGVVCEDFRSIEHHFITDLNDS